VISPQDQPNWARLFRIDEVLEDNRKLETNGWRPLHSAAARSRSDGGPRRNDGKEILQAYPDLESGGITEPLRYAAEAVRKRELPLNVP
jgi:hypothetical protein